MLLLGCVLGLSCTSSVQTEAEPPPLSLRVLVGSPDDYVGQEVVVEGFVGASWGGGGVFVSEQAERQGQASRGVRIAEREDGPTFAHADGTFARVAGLFLTPTQQLDDWAGVIVVKKIGPIERYRPVDTSSREIKEISREEADRILETRVDDAEMRARRAD